MSNQSYRTGTISNWSTWWVGSVALTATVGMYGCCEVQPAGRSTSMRMLTLVGVMVLSAISQLGYGAAKNYQKHHNSCGVQARALGASNEYLWEAFGASTPV